LGVLETKHFGVLGELLLLRRENDVSVHWDVYSGELKRNSLDRTHGVVLPVDFGCVWKIDHGVSSE
jgi:hypothetical protein